MGKPQEIHFDDGTLEQDIFWLVSQARSYMRYAVPLRYEEGMERICRNYNEQCAYWALIGECQSNPECTWMEQESGVHVPCFFDL